MKQRGRAALVIDIQRGDWCDISKNDVYNTVKGWIQSGLVWGLWLGTPYNGFTLARRGPPGSSMPRPRPPSWPSRSRSSGQTCSKQVELDARSRRGASTPGLRPSAPGRPGKLSIILPLVDAKPPALSQATKRCGASGRLLLLRATVPSTSYAMAVAPPPRQRSGQHDLQRPQYMLLLCRSA